MARALPVILLALAISGCFAGEPGDKLFGVHDLTPDTFDKVVNSGKAAFVEFYAPWCGHCKHLTPEYKALGELVEADPELKARVTIAKVNADEHHSLGERFNVGGFPTIKFFPRGKEPSKETAVNFNGERTSDAMVAYIKRKLTADKGFARVDALDVLAEKANKAAKADLKKVVEELEAAVGKLEGEDKVNGEIYVKLAKKAIEKGTEFFAAERARLERMIASGSVAPSKVSEMLRNSSVLGGFLGEAKEAPGPDKDEEEEEEEEYGEEEEGGEEGEEEEEEVINVSVQDS